MTTCPECGEPLQPLDVTCSDCGAPRLEEQATRSDSTAGNADRQTATEPASQETARLSADGASSLTNDDASVNSEWRGVIFLIGFSFAVINLLGPPAAEIFRKGFGLFMEIFRFIDTLHAGASCAQLALLSLWWIFAPLPRLRRIGLGVAMAAIWLASQFAGLCMTTTFRRPFSYTELSEAIGTALASLILALVAIQLPLWFAKIWFGWRVECRVDQQVPSTPREPLRIADVLIVTALIAGALALARASTTDSSSPGVVFLYLSIYVVVAVPLSAILLLPSLWAVLRPVRPPIGMLVVSTLHAGVVLIPLMIALASEGGSNIPLSSLLILCLTMGSYFAPVMIVLFTCRRHGYRLYWKNE